MAPLPGPLSPTSSPPSSPPFNTAPLAPPSPSPSRSPSQPTHDSDYAHIVRSLQRRSTDRVSLAALASPSRGALAEAHHPVPALEADLRLAAQIGQTLLADKTALQARLDAAERAKTKLLDRLTASVKEGNALQRRLEETVANLENADASNRALLVSLEEDRKTISRLSSEAGRAVQAQTKLSALQRAHDDTRQELASERRRADAAEAKARKLGERATELEERLRRATADLEEMRQDKVLSARRSLDALNRARAAAGASKPRGAAAQRGAGAPAPLTPASGDHASDDDDEGGAVAAGTDALSDNPEAKELLRMVETLARENTLLRSESMELRGLLDDSRDEQCDLRSAMMGAREAALPEEAEGAEDDEWEEGNDNDRPRRYSHASSAARSAVAAAPDAAALPEEEGAAGDLPSWASGASLVHSAARAADLSRTLSAGSGSDDPQSRRIGVGARPPPVTSASTGALGMGRRPGAGRGHSRRAMSMDVSSQVKSFIGSAPTSPRIEYSPSTRPASIFSNASEDVEPRPRRHHRPLSLSLGPSVFPLVPEDEPDRGPVSPFTRQAGTSHRRRPSQAPSLTGLSIGLASPRPVVNRGPRRSYSPERAPATGRTDAGTQTTPPRAPPPPTVLSPSSPGPSTPRSRSRASQRSPSPRLGPAPSSASSVHSTDAPASTAAPSLALERAGRAEQRTAALGQLIEHAAKLLHRVQGADIATQEKRLRKQNLPGDVRHLAQANLRDLVNEIDSVRTHFRRVVEVERAAQARSPSPSAASAAAAASADASLVTRRDFVSLVKLVRDLLFESSRLRMLVNQVQLDPALAGSLKEMDVPDAFDALVGAASASAAAASQASTSTAGGLLAPLSRLFGGAADPTPSSSSSLLSPGEHHSSLLSHKASSAQLRPPLAKRGGSSTVSTATVNVEFGSGQVRQAESAGSPVAQVPSPSTATSGRAASRPRHGQVKRDLASIFAGASSSSSSSSTTARAGSSGPEHGSFSSSTSSATPIPQAQAHGHDAHSGAPAGRLASAAFSSAASYIPFGRLLSSYRPALSSTTNAVLDSLPHSSSAAARSPSAAGAGAAAAAAATDDRPPTLLERQLRPRGLSDSSIRSTFVAHANPHHRLVTAAGLALSAEPARADGEAAMSVSPAAAAAVAAGAVDALRERLREELGAGRGGGAGLAPVPAGAGAGAGEGRSVSRRPSAAHLRGRKASSSRLKGEPSTAATSPSSPPPPPPVPPVMVVTSSAATSESSLSLGTSPPPRTRTAPSSPQPISISTSPSPSALNAHAHAHGHEPGAGGTTGSHAASLLGSLASSAFESLAKQATGAGREEWKERGRLG